jgi:nucleotide-binding universal stress UspA family protein
MSDRTEHHHVAGAPVVVGVDGSARGLAAVEVAAAEAALRHRPLVVVHALVWSPAGVALDPATAPPLHQAYRERGEGFVAEAIELAAQCAPDVRVSGRVIAGAAPAVLIEQAGPAGLLVVGEGGSDGLADRLIGSVAFQVATHAGGPVLVVRGDRRTDGPVVVGVDGSPNSVEALAFAAEAAALRAAELVAVHAWGGNDGTQLNDELPMGFEFWASEPQEERVVAEALAGIGEKYPDLWVERQLGRGSARRLLTDRSHAAQLVVVGSRGHGGFAGLLLGSVGQHLVHHAGCPVAIVPRQG